MKKLAILLLFLIPAGVSADPCRARCRDRARACKDRCHLAHENPFDERRHRCEKVCVLHEHECRAGC